MELTQHYISYGFRVTVTGTQNGFTPDAETILATDLTKSLAQSKCQIASTYIGVDKQTAIGHATSQMMEKGYDVMIVDCMNIDHCFVAIPAMMELRSIEVGDLT